MKDTLFLIQIDNEKEFYIIQSIILSYGINWYSMFKTENSKLRTYRDFSQGNNVLNIFYNYSYESIFYKNVYMIGNYFNIKDTDVFICNGKNKINELIKFLCGFKNKIKWI